MKTLVVDEEIKIRYELVVAEIVLGIPIPKKYHDEMTNEIIKLRLSLRLCSTFH